ncbi:hypothetical protein HAV21_03510 [Paenarthrobacter sp. MSM-2-10-13]|uniref:hypothetical protein n=1 Tax=Paenarthrobacter sp. MSM-2-10-13 TaxID=2717318 RepID=UPI0014226436|nr:hypothetical protein [Paenarthrobacter sp. MSM-2-10-13]NHW45965.1 hypothetical protein [Paenarthrobacter sp. MSM-2-10-13]
MLATPPPVIINMPDTGAPWWGVPLMAGVFLLIGAVIAFLSTRASDNRKAKRDKAERIMIDTRSVGLEYLEAATHLAEVVKGQESEHRALPSSEYLLAIHDALIDLRAKWRKFELFAQEDALKTGQALFNACLILMIPGFEKEEVAGSIRDFESAKLNFINTLRAASGVGIIEVKTLDPATEKALKEASGALVNDIGERLTHAHGGSGHKQ